MDNDNLNRLYSREIRTLEKANEIDARNDLTLEKIKLEYSKLVNSYDKLLSTVKKLTKIGDSTNRKLLKTTRELEVKEEEVSLLLKDTLTSSIKILHKILDTTYPEVLKKSFRIRNYSLSILKYMELTDVWKFEVASILCLIGYIALPKTLVDNVMESSQFKNNSIFYSHTEFGANLINTIPRMEEIAQIIRMHEVPFHKYSDLEDAETNDNYLGSQIIKVAIDFDDYISRKYSVEYAIYWLNRNIRLYNPKLVKILEKIYLNQEQ
ncbi:MAG: hypothetical protein JXR48_14370 [Candidatus Delongbacteria bacterium]|nr:hypothetical protein [Candidatus Delongbacteria bacterium]MBN2836140.1 hypothetical protein [Candidatus Delongbacteria bacterium]